MPTVRGAHLTLGGREHEAGQHVFRDGTDRAGLDGVDGRRQGRELRAGRAGARPAVRGLVRGRDEGEAGTDVHAVSRPDGRGDARRRSAPRDHAGQGQGDAGARPGGGIRRAGAHRGGTADARHRARRRTAVGSRRGDGSGRHHQRRRPDARAVRAQPGGHVERATVQAASGRRTGRPRRGRPGSGGRRAQRRQRRRGGRDARCRYTVGGRAEVPEQG